MLELTIERVIPAPREKVYDAWLDPAALTKFMTPGPEMTVPKAETDPKVGGTFLVVMKAGDQEMPHTGEYREMKRPDKLVFTWQSPFTEEAHLVTLTFAEVDGDKTKLTLHHAGLENEESRKNHEGGWNMIVETLAGVVA